MRVRAAVAGYMLLRWSVDPSPDHNLQGHGYKLWLRITWRFMVSRTRY